MKANSISFGYSTEKLMETKKFYETFLSVKTVYQIEGYIVLRISETFLLEFSSPQMTGVRKSDLTGVGINIDVNDVKKEYEEMLKKGVEIDMHLKEHEWGEIAFSIKDPNGLMIYVCKTIEK